MSEESRRAQEYRGPPQTGYRYGLFSILLALPSFFFVEEMITFAIEFLQGEGDFVLPFVLACTSFASLLFGIAGVAYWRREDNAGALTLLLSILGVIAACLSGLV